jgi:hypothetical protein
MAVISTSFYLDLPMRNSFHKFLERAWKSQKDSLKKETMLLKDLVQNGPRNRGCKLGLLCYGDSQNGQHVATIM